MTITSVRHIRWVPPEYRELASTVTPIAVSDEWITFDLGDPPVCMLWLPWRMLLRYRYAFGESWYEPDFPWHADVVAVSSESDGTLVVKDMLVDVMISEDGNRYKVIDLDQLVEAMEHGKVTQGECFEALRVLQAWLQMLHGFGVLKDFPPKSLPAQNERD